MSKVVYINMNYKLRNTFLSEYRSYFELSYLTYEGGIEYIKKMLSRHLRETDSHFQKRLEIASNINLIGKIITIITSFILTDVERKINIKEEIINQYLSKIDLEQSLNEFLEKKIIEYLLTDNAFTIVDSDGERAYCHDINYLNIYDFQKKFGKLNYIDIMLEESSIIRFEADRVSYARTDDYFSDKGPVFYTESPNTIDVIPFVSVNSKMNSKIAYFRDAIYIQKTIFNHYNNINQQLIDTGFTILMIPGSIPKDKANTDEVRYIEYLSNSQAKPEFIGPPTTHLDFYLKFIAHLQEQLLNSLNIYREKTVSNTSGLSKSYDYSIMARNIANISLKMQEFEKSIWKMIALYDSRVKPENIEIQYPKNFDLKSLSEQLNNVMRVSSMQISETLSKELEKKLARKFIENEQTLSKIDKEIDTKNYTVTANKEFSQLKNQL